MPAFDYSAIHDLYDSYCTFDGDLPFWTSVADRTGTVLELMAGTGRVSLPLLTSGVRLTCIDSDPGMLAVLAQKLSRTCPVICGDALRLPFRRAFDQILLPFQGLSELVEREQRQALFTAVAQTLARRGTFICTAHNPSVRSASLNGEWQVLGPFPHRDGSVEVRVRGTVSGQFSVVTGEQQVTVRDHDGSTLRDHVLPLRFSLPPLDEILELAANAGLRVTSVFGNYDRSPYDPSTSRAIIACFTA